MIPRTDHQAFDLTPYAATFPAREGVKLGEVHRIITFNIAKNAFKTAATELYTKSKIQFTAVVLTIGAAMISLHFIFARLLNSQYENPEDEQATAHILFYEACAALILLLGCDNIYSFVRRNDILSPREINLSRSLLSESHIDKMNYEQFFELLRPWRELSDYLRFIIFTQSEPIKRSIVDYVRIWRNMDLAHFVEICRDRVVETRKIIQKNPHLYPFLVQHLPDTCRSEAQLLTRINPFFCDSLATNLLRHLDENCLIPSEDTTTGAAASSSSAPTEDTTTSAAASSTPVEQSENYLSIRFKGMKELLILPNHPVLKNSFFRDLIRQTPNSLPKLTTPQFELLERFLNYGEDMIDDSNVIMLNILAASLGFADDANFSLLLQLARRIERVDMSLFFRQRAPVRLKLSKDKDKQQEIIDIFEEKIFHSQGEQICIDIVNFLDLCGRTDLYNHLIQNIQDKTKEIIENMLDGHYGIGYLCRTLNGMSIIKSHKLRRSYTIDLFRILQKKNWNDNNAFDYPIDELWRYATEHNHEALKQLVKSFVASDEGQGNLQDTMSRNGWFLLPAEMQI